MLDEAVTVGTVGERDIEDLGVVERLLHTRADRMKIVGSVYVIDRPIVFDTTKDRPVLLSAIGSDAEYLITSDKADFAHILGTVVYGVNVRTPKTFLLEMGIVG